MHRGKIFGHTQRVPHADDVEHHADPDALGAFSQDAAQHQPVRHDLVSLVLKMVLGEPERIEAELVGKHTHVQDTFSGIPALFG